jgi:hypothetical protein
MKNLHDTLVDACKAALRDLQTARQNAADLGGPKCAEATFFDPTIEKVAKALRFAHLGECEACGSPNNKDGTCSRSQCYNAD